MEVANSHYAPLSDVSVTWEPRQKSHKTAVPHGTDPGVWQRRTYQLVYGSSGSGITETGPPPTGSVQILPFFVLFTVPLPFV
jgi:hypothetical protein